MSRIKLMNASFEESLNLQDDSLITYMIQDVEQPGVKEKPVLLRSLGVILVIVLYVISLISTNSLDRSYAESSIPKPVINFLPVRYFFILLLIYLLIWIWSE